MPVGVKVLGFKVKVGVSSFTVECLWFTVQG